MEQDIAERLKPIITHWHEHEAFKSIPLEQFLREQGVSDEEQRTERKVIESVHYRLMGLR